MAHPDPYRSLVEHAPYGIFRSTPDGRILTANPALVRMLGYASEDELVELDLERDVYESAAERRRLVEEHSTEPYSGVVARWRRADDVVITVRLSGRPIREDGSVQAFETFVEDISEDVRNEAELRETREHHRALVEHLPDAVVIHDGKRIVFANPRAAELVGVEDPDAVVGRPILDLVPPGHRDTVQERIETLLTSGEAMPPLNLPVRRADGTAAAVEITGMATRWKGRKAVLLVGRDLTERQRVEEVLAELLQMAPDPIIVTDERQRIVRVNQAAEILFGYESEQMIGQPLERLIPDEQRNAHRAHVDAFAEGPDRTRDMAIRQSVEARRSDGTTVPIEASIGRVHVAGQTRFMALVRDISERLELQEEAEEGRRLSALTTMAAGMAHHFNNRLTVLRGHADLALLDLPEDHHLRDDIRAIVDNARAAARLAERILTFGGGGGVGRDSWSSPRWSGEPSRPFGAPAERRSRWTCRTPTSPCRSRPTRSTSRKRFVSSSRTPWTRSRTAGPSP